MVNGSSPLGILPAIEEVELRTGECGEDEGAELGVLERALILGAKSEEDTVDNNEFGGPLLESSECLDEISIEFTGASNAAVASN